MREKAHITPHATFGTKLIETLMHLEAGACACPDGS